MSLFTYSAAVTAAKQANTPLVALESTVISHGLPYPQNLTLATEMEAVVSANGATPATIALIDGQVQIGLDETTLNTLATAGNVVKVSRRDLAAVSARKQHGATTVASTMLLAEKAGISVFATGGIGGVHRDSNWDISADLIELSQTPVVVVCAGAKSILDLPATMEVLETYGVPVIGYQTDELPAFFTRESGIGLQIRAESPAEIADIVRQQRAYGLKSGILVTVPVPEAVAMDAKDAEAAINEVMAQAAEQGVHGKALTPFLLSGIAKLTGGESVETNMAFLKQNAAIAAQIAVELGA